MHTDMSNKIQCCSATTHKMHITQSSDKTGCCNTITHKMRIIHESHNMPHRKDGIFICKQIVVLRVDDDNPTYIQRCSGHAVWLGTVALPHDWQALVANNPSTQDARASERHRLHSTYPTFGMQWTDLIRNHIWL